MEFFCPFLKYDAGWYAFDKRRRGSDWSVTEVSEDVGAAGKLAVVAAKNNAAAAVPASTEDGTAGAAVSGTAAASRNSGDLGDSNPLPQLAPEGGNPTTLQRPQKSQEPPRVYNMLTRRVVTEQERLHALGPNFPDRRNAPAVAARGSRPEPRSPTFSPAARQAPGGGGGGAAHPPQHPQQPRTGFASLLELIQFVLTKSIETSFSLREEGGEDQAPANLRQKTLSVYVNSQRL